MAKKFYCINECFHLNKRFRIGDQFPDAWLAKSLTVPEYAPNKHFQEMTESEAKEYAKENRAKKMLTASAGDDKRSTAELKAALSKHTNINEKWTRKEIWVKLRTYEMAEGRTASQETKGKK